MQEIIELKRFLQKSYEPLSQFEWLKFMRKFSPLEWFLFCLQGFLTEDVTGSRLFLQQQVRIIKIMILCSNLLEMFMHSQIF